MQKMITFTDKLYMMIEEHPPLPSLELDEPILDIKKSKKKYLSDFTLKKQDIRLYFKKEQVNTVFSLIKRQIK
jgi:hypothetical protein